jgi:hypothetical protein
MTRLNLLALALLSLALFSCESRRSRMDHKNLIPEDELVSILTDTYLANGLLGMPKIYSRYSQLDSVSTYNYVVEQHGYSKEAMDKTIRYYFIKKPKKLIRIYDRALGKLSEMESLVQKEIARTKAHVSSLWTGQDSWSFPDPSGSDSTLFDLKLNKAGLYTLTAIVTLFPDDQTLNPRIEAYSCNADSLETGKRNHLKPVYYFKDGKPHKYTLLLNVPLKTTLHVRGNFYEFDNNPDDWEKHLNINNISLIYSFSQ